MTATELPLWLALPIAALLIAGASLTLIGCLGLLRLDSFYERVHAPTLGTTLGIGSVLVASSLYFSFTGARPVLHEALIAIFIVVTTPVTLMLLTRAALHRVRRADDASPPPPAL